MSGVPANAVYVTLASTCLLALIIIGSTAAFNIVLSVSATGLFTSYLTCVVCVLGKRLRGEQFPATKWSLGKAGLPINILAVCFLVIAFFFLFFPAVPSPGPADMNWAILIVSCSRKKRTISKPIRLLTHHACDRSTELR